MKELERLAGERMLLPRGCRVLCAVSGGADSVCLLGMLYALRDKLGFTLSAAHYNHNLRGAESLRDENFVRELTAARFPDVPLYIGGGDVAGAAARRGTGLEETAREMRYAFLRETAARIGCDRIATAHTADDNAETILLHLCRGAGLQGLAGISPMRGELIRPLLTTTRREVEAFLNEHDLPHVEDSSNGADTFARNRLRHQVMPVLEELYPGLACRMTDNAARLREDEGYLSEQAARLLIDVRAEGKALCVPAAAVGEAPDPIAIRAVRQLLKRLRGGDDTCAAAHLESVLRLCRSETPSGEVHLPDGLTARREYERLILERARPESTFAPVPLAMPGVTEAGDWEIVCEDEIYRGQRQTGRQFWLSKAKVPALLARPRQTGDALKPPGRHNKTLKKWLVEEHIPRLERDGLPVLVCGEEVAAAALIGPQNALCPGAGEEARRITLRDKRKERVR